MIVSTAGMHQGTVASASSTTQSNRMPGIAACASVSAGNGVDQIAQRGELDEQDMH
jgi:hypothetical protein